MFICKYCGRVCKNDNSLRNHERLCKQNPDRQILKSNFIEYNKKVKSGEIVKLYKNQYDKSKKIGLPKPELSPASLKKMSDKAKLHKHSDISRKKISDSMKLAVINNPESYSSNNVCGRTKQIIYNGVKLMGKWELYVAEYLDKHNIKWERPIISFPYEWNNEVHYYFPDFYLPDYDRYIEVKGYERERDLLKYKTIKDLIIIKQKEIKEILNNTYVLNL